MLRSHWNREKRPFRKSDSKAGRFYAADAPAPFFSVLRFFRPSFHTHAHACCRLLTKKSRARTNLCSAFNSFMWVYERKHCAAAYTEIKFYFHTGKNGLRRDFKNSFRSIPTPRVTPNRQAKTIFSRQVWKILSLKKAKNLFIGILNHYVYRYTINDSVNHIARSILCPESCYKSPMKALYTLWVCCASVVPFYLCRTSENIQNTHPFL